MGPKHTIGALIVRYLITGSSGFIGKRLVTHLQYHGNSVIGVDLMGGADVIADIRSVDWGSLGIGELDGVVHLAAKTSVPESINHPEMYEETNVIATRRLFEWCVKEKIPKVVFASSAAVYGDSPAELKMIGEEGGLASPYAETKMEGERMAKKFSSEGTNFTCLRFFNVYGKGQSADSGYSAVIPSFIQNQLNGQPLIVHGTGDQTRDFVNVDDVCRAITGSLEADLGQFKIINVGTGSGVSIRELCDIVISAACRLGLEPVEISNAPGREGDVDRSIADIRDLDLVLETQNLVMLQKGIFEQFISKIEEMNNNGVRGNKIGK